MLELRNDCVKIRLLKTAQNLNVEVGRRATTTTRIAPSRTTLRPRPPSVKIVTQAYATERWRWGGSVASRWRTCRFRSSRQASPAPTLKPDSPVTSRLRPDTRWSRIEESCVTPRRRRDGSAASPRRNRATTRTRPGKVRQEVRWRTTRSWRRPGERSTTTAAATTM